MASSGSVFSQTLQEITTTKLEELANKRSTFEQQKTAAIDEADSKDDPLEMLSALAEGARTCFSVATRDRKIVRGSSSNPRLETDLRNLNRFMDQARFDPSVSSKIIQQWRLALLKHLEVQSLKYQYANLYGQLTVEWLTSLKPQATKAKPEVQDVDKMDISNDFEEVAAKAKVEARQAWERSAFEEANVNRSAIDGFLTQLFEKEEAQAALQSLRKDIENIEIALASQNQFNQTTLGWTIKRLLASDLLTNEKRQALRDFQSNDIILTELADVLNMRMTALSSWSWGQEVAVEARRSLNGQYNIYMHTDLLQTIFVTYIGVKWSVMIKASLMRFQANTNVWKSSRRELSPLDRQRRRWFLSSDALGMYTHKVRDLSYRGGYFVSQLMDEVDQDLEVEEGDEEAAMDVAGEACEVKRPKLKASHDKKYMPPHSRRSARQEECEESDDDMGFGYFDDEPSVDMTPYKPKNPIDAKQRLLHLLSTEVLLKTRLQNEITCFRSQYQELKQSLPHATISAVLSFFGVSNHWLEYFNKFLQAPLKFLDEEEGPRTRKRGAPTAHVLSDVFGEVILFCLDFTVNQEAGGEVLWRMHDDVWFWSASHEKCVKMWKTIQKFNKLMGICCDESRSGALRMQRQKGQVTAARIDKSLPTGDIRWGMIYLDDTSGRFTVDEDMVDKHIEELRRQLKEKEKSIFTWVQAYSTYASVFFTTNFGKPANCFGREHIDMMLSMHERVQKTLFSTSGGYNANSVVDWLKKQIERRFGVKDVPDGYLFFPTALGGLDVKSPFIGLLQLRESVTVNPQALLTTFEKAEQEHYNSCKKSYLDRKAWEYPKRDKDYRPDNPQHFMSFEEYTKFREDVNYGYQNQLHQVYENLLRQPQEEPLEIDQNVEISAALDSIPNAYGQRQTMTSWYGMDSYWKWVTMLYGPEMIQRFGNFEIVDSGLLPMGMVSLFKSGRVSWQE